MVLEHETKLHDLRTRAGYEVRAAMTLRGEMNKAMGGPADELSESTARRIEMQQRSWRGICLYLEPPTRGPYRRQAHRRVGRAAGCGSLTWKRAC